MVSRIVASSTLLVSFCCQAIDPAGLAKNKDYFVGHYELSLFAVKNDQLEIRRALMAADGNGDPVPNEGDRQPRAFKTTDDPSVYWMDVPTVDLASFGGPHCYTLGEGLGEGTKSDEQYGAGVSLLDPDDPTRRLDAFYCDNNVLFLIDRGEVIDALEIVDPEAPKYQHPAQLTYSLDFDGVLFLSRANRYVKIVIEQRKLRQDGPGAAINTNESPEAIWEKIFGQEFQQPFTQEQYQKDFYTPLLNNANQETGLSVHYSQTTGKTYLIPTQNSRFPQQFRGTRTRADIFQAELDPQGNLAANFTDSKANTGDFLSSFAMNDGTGYPNGKTDDKAYGVGTLYGKGTTAVVHGPRPIEGDVTGVTSNHLRKFHLGYRGIDNVFYDYADFRGHHGLLVTSPFPTGPSGEVSYSLEARSKDGYMTITGLEQRTGTNETNHFDVLYEKQYMDLMRFVFNGTKVEVPPLIVSKGVQFGETLKRQRTDKTDKFKTGAAMDIIQMDHLGRTLVCEIGSGLANTNPPAGMAEGYELYVTRPMTERMKDKNRVTDAGVNLFQHDQATNKDTVKLNTFSADLFLRVQKPSVKEFYDAAWITPVIYRSTEAVNTTPR